MEPLFAMSAYEWVVAACVYVGQQYDTYIGWYWG